MKNIKSYNNFVKINENIQVSSIIGILIGLSPAIAFAGWAGFTIVKNFIEDRRYKKQTKKIYDVFNKYKDDPTISPILMEYSRLSRFGSEEADGSKAEYYSEKRLGELSDIINNRLKELMSDTEYREFKKYRSFIVNALKKKYYNENPEEYRKNVNYVPEWDKDTMVDKFLEDASDFFNEGYKARNWRSRIKSIIENKWVIENNNIILEDMEEEDDDGMVYLDPVTNEFIWDITENSFSEGYHERNFREFLSHMIPEKGYKISRKAKYSHHSQDTSTFDSYKYK